MIKLDKVITRPLNNKNLNTTNTQKRIIIYLKVISEILTWPKTLSVQKEVRDNHIMKGVREVEVAEVSQGEANKVIVKIQFTNSALGVF